LEKKRLMEAGAEEAAAGGKTRTQLDKEKRLERLKRESKKALKARVQQLEQEIADAEALVERLEASMGDAEVYSNPDKAAAAARDHREAQERLEALYEEWTDTAALAEESGE
ncbi:MAG: hypothetical protein IKS52_04115, partial [Clostridia bacterium]|nr:hypothetical protein [Clostridia bacterium]